MSNLLMNIITASVTTCIAFLIINDPITAFELIADTAIRITQAFSTDQWKVLGLTLAAVIGFQYRQVKKLAGREFSYDGRRFVAQSFGNEGMPGMMGTTSTDRGTAQHTDEANQASNVGVKSPQEKLSLQVQVAPNLAETVTLRTAKLDEHYSTPMYVGQFTFPTTAVTNTVLCQVESNAIFTNKNLQRLFIDKRFVKYDLRFMINVTGNPFATGLFALAVLPNPPLIEAGVEFSHGVAWTDLYDRVLASNHVLVDVSCDDVYTLDMPYSHFASYLSSQTYTQADVNYSYGTLYGVCISPYLPPTGSTSAINFEVYATIINLETIETAPYVAQSLLSIGETTNIVTKLDHVNNAALPINVTGDTLTASVPNAVGLDNPADPRNPETSVFRMAYQKLMSWKNVVDVFRMTNTPSTLASMTPTIAEDLRLAVDEMSMDFFRGRLFSPSSNNFIPITTSMATGTRLFTLPITPFQQNAFGGNFTTNTNTDFSMWISSFFRYWRGSMKFRIVLASNNFKRGKILVCVNYGGLGTADLPGTIIPGSIDPRSIHHIVIDLANKDRIIDIEVPFKATYEFLRVPNLVGNQTQYNYEEYSLGTIAAYLVSPLQVANGTASAVNMNVFQAWGKDFQLFNLSGSSGSAFSTQSKLQVPPSPMIESRRHLMSPFQNLRELIQRPALIGTYSLIPHTGVNDGTAVQLIPITHQFMSTDAAWSGLCSAYSGMRGGLRVLLRFNNIELSTSVRVSYFENLITTNGTYGFQPTADATGAYWSSDFYNSIQSSAINVAATNVPQITYPPNLQSPAVVAAGATPPVGNVTQFGTSSYHDVVVDPYSQPELILECPDNCPMYTSRPTTVYPPNALFSTPTGGNYNPFWDRTVGWLAITLTDNVRGTPVTPVPSQGTVSVSLMAADDTRFFRYNGGPTTIIPQCSGLVRTGSTFTYTKIDGV